MDAATAKRVATLIPFGEELLGVDVTLTWSEVASAGREGIQRRIRAMARGRQLPGGWDHKRRAGRWDNDIESACAERAAAKGLGIYWPEGDMPDYGGDLPGGWHVRSTDREDGSLLVYPDDPDGGRFVLIVGVAPTYRLAGWLYGREAKDAKWASGDRLARPGFMIPQSCLRLITA
jgi:hypothetical protein